jgi:hypothetical protein
MTHLLSPKPSRSLLRGSILPAIAVTALSVASVASLAIAAPAQAASLTWDVNFISNGSSVGSGLFSFDPTSVSSVPTGPESDPTSPTYTGVPITQVIESFSAVVQGVNWSGPNSYTWIDKTTGVLKSARAARGQIVPSIGEGWYLGDLIGDRQFTMNGRQTSESAISGTWSQFLAPLVSPPGSPPSGLLGSGSWSATLRTADAVPEPTTLVGLLVAGGMGIAARRRAAQS